MSKYRKIFYIDVSKLPKSVVKRRMEIIKYKMTKRKEIYKN